MRLFSGFILLMICLSCHQALLLPQRQGKLVRKGTRLHAGFALVSKKDGGEVEGGEEQGGGIRSCGPDSNCPCGSGASYKDCCQPYHTKAQQPHDPVSLIRSRYSAYSLENIDYILDSTSRASPDYVAYVENPAGARAGRKKWIKDIRKNMVDGFSFVRMEVDRVEVDPEDNEQAMVYYRHMAIGKAENTMFPVEETAYVSKSDGVWQFEAATVQRPAPERSQAMMETWPGMMGLKMNFGPKESESEGEGGGAGAVPSPPQSPAERPPRTPRPRRAPKKESGASAPMDVRQPKLR